MKKLTKRKNRGERRSLNTFRSRTFDNGTRCGCAAVGLNKEQGGPVGLFTGKVSVFFLLVVVVIFYLFVQRPDVKCHLCVPRSDVTVHVCDPRSDVTVHVCDPRSEMTVHVCDPRSEMTVHVCDPCTQEAEEGGSL